MALRFTTATDAEVGQTAELCALCLPGAPKDYFEIRMLRDPELLPGGRLIAKDGDRIVSNVTACVFDFIYGSATFKCGGIANVATHPEYRGRGAAKALVAEAHALMRRHGMPVSLLGTGIPEFYAPFGYVPWTRAETSLLKPQPPLQDGPAPGIRPLDLPGDIPAMRELRRSYARAFVGGLDRSEAVWNAHFAWTPHYPGEVVSLGAVAESGGKLRAYVRATVDAGNDTAGVAEFCTAPAAGKEVEALARGFAREVVNRNLNAINLPAICQDFAAAVSPFCAAVSSTRNSSYMFSVMDLAGFLSALSPELAARRPGTGRVLIEHGKQAAVVNVKGKEVNVTAPAPVETALRASLPPAQWIEVFMGAKPFSAQPFGGRSRVGEKEINLLDAMFPKLDSVFWAADAF